MNTIRNWGEGHGRLGNQMFQLALLFALRTRRGHDFFLPRAGESLWGCFDLDVPAEGPPTSHRFDEELGSCNFDPRVLEQPDGTVFGGYYQSYRYLEGCEDELRRFLRFRVEHRAHAEALAFTYRRRHGRPLVSLHVRRGDYVRTGYESHWGNLATDGYYQRAIEQIGDQVTYLVMSDDMAWCRTSLGLDHAEFVDVDHGASLGLMSICDVNIVANSSYSWWGAFLNPAAEVYAPSRWFGPDMEPPNDRQDDIVLPTWRTIPTFAARAAAT